MIPTSLYIHVPWCVKKCPYCDFNSHQSPDQRPDSAYFKRLFEDLKAQCNHHAIDRPIASIFIGGGTPSLIAPEYYQQLFQDIQTLTPFSKHIEITLEANPGTLDESRFKEYHNIGINRLSIGVQSFHANALKQLGRIHDEQQAHHALLMARSAGFKNINIDLMHGLPHQTVQEGLTDLAIALSYQPEHLSWYQLTLEQNTAFYKKPPTLPDEETLAEIEAQGFNHLSAAGYDHYEISAFSKPGHQSQHNLNYWLFGDYYGIGAGAHGKWTQRDHTICRTQTLKIPKSYIQSTSNVQIEYIKPQDLPFEFMLNATRLNDSIPLQLYQERTYRAVDELLPFLIQAKEKGWIDLTKTHWKITDFGRRFTNDLQSLFLV